MRKHYSTLLIILLAACSSGPVPIEYYVLNSPASQQLSATAPCTAPYSMAIESVELASFLRGSGLVYQTTDNQLSVSKAHLWAEKLDQSLPKALLGHMRHMEGDCHFYLKGHDWYLNEDFRVRVRIDQFQATSGGEVISSGQFQIIDSREASPALTREFNFTRELGEEGYAHAVAQMDLLVADLAKAILGAVPTSESP
jgi:uncharacterized lipoprotein YmbA